MVSQAPARPGVQAKTDKLFSLVIFCMDILLLRKVIEVSLDAWTDLLNHLISQGLRRPGSPREPGRLGQDLAVDLSGLLERA